MNWQEYLEQARRTQPAEMDIDYLIVSLLGEVGEFLNVVKKYTGHGHNQEWAALQSMVEAGDVIWYLCATHDYYKIKNTEPETLFALDKEANLNRHSRSAGVFAGRLAKKAQDNYITKSGRVDAWNLQGVILTATFTICGCKTEKECEDVLARILDVNIDRLRDRYPEGFSEEKSKNRKEYNGAKN